MKRSEKNSNNLNYKKQRGAVAIIVALSIFVLMGFAGLVLDLGKLFVTKTELQNSVDACALAAARELTGGDVGQLTLAENAGIETGTRHKVLLQGESVVLRQNQDVTFSETLNGTYLTKDAVANPLSMRFARCTAERTDIVNWFMQILGISNQKVSATAVASLVSGQTSCAIPVAICSSVWETAKGTPGIWVEGALGPKGELSGAAKFVDYSSPAGGASELNAMLAGPGVCARPAIGSEVGEGGVKSSLSKGWNSRFGIYANSIESDPSEAGFARPDKSGYAYTDMSFPAKFNAFADFTSKRNSNAPYQGDDLTGLRAQGGGNETMGKAFLEANGDNSRRVAIAAVVDCDVLDEGGPTAPVIDWACVFMLHPINFNQGVGTGLGTDRMYLEVIGKASDLKSPCATIGAVGGPGGIGPLVPGLVQ